MIYDLHTHSNASDGVLSPQALVARAKQRGVTHLALTDHDTTEGLKTAKLASEQEGISLINGIELSSQWQGKSIHVVGLNIQPDDENLQLAIRSQSQLRQSRGEEIARRLAKLGFEDVLKGAEKYADGAAIGRPHFARYLVEIGAVTSVANAFKKYLGAGKVGDVKQVWPDLEQTCSNINQAGGIAVLAHPLRYDLTMTKIRAVLDEFKAVGGRGIEVVSGRQTVNETKSAMQLAERFQLLGSCGSDFHVPDQPWQELGSFGTLPSACTPVWQAWL